MQFLVLQQHKRVLSRGYAACCVKRGSQERISSHETNTTDFCSDDRCFFIRLRPGIRYEGKRQVQPSCRYMESQPGEIPARPESSIPELDPSLRDLRRL